MRVKMPLIAIQDLTKGLMYTPNLKMLSGIQAVHLETLKLKNKQVTLNKEREFSGR